MKEKQKRLEWLEEYKDTHGRFTCADCGKALDIHNSYHYEEGFCDDWCQYNYIGMSPEDFI